MSRGRSRCAARTARPRPSSSHSRVSRYWAQARKAALGDLRCITEHSRRQSTSPPRTRASSSVVAGELIFHVFGAIAHFERRLIAERTKDGIAVARAKGKRPGRQPLDATALRLP